MLIYKKYKPEVSCVGNRVGLIDRNCRDEQYRDNWILWKLSLNAYDKLAAVNDVAVMHRDAMDKNRPSSDNNLAT